MKIRTFLIVGPVICFASTLFAAPQVSVLTLTGHPVAGIASDSAGDIFYNSSSELYELSHGATSLTPLVSLSSVGNAVTPITVDSSGDIYGVSPSGGTSSDGVLYEYVAATKQLKTLATFTGSNGADPTGHVVVDSAGDVFGTTEYGGDLTQDGGKGAGTAWVVQAGTGVVSTLDEFSEAGTPLTNGGYFPQGGLTSDSAGNLYGTTSAGGKGGGTVFTIGSLRHAVGTLYSVAANNGTLMNGVTADAAGDLYWITTGGVVSELPAGDTSSLPLGDAPSGANISYSGLLVGPSGNLFFLESSSSINQTTLYESVARSGVVSNVSGLGGSIYGIDAGYTMAADGQGIIYGATGSTNANIFDVAGSGYLPEPVMSSVVLCGMILALPRQRFHRNHA